jgi:hypothetical protein
MSPPQPVVVSCLQRLPRHEYPTGQVLGQLTLCPQLLVVVPQATLAQASVSDCEQTQVVVPGMQTKPAGQAQPLPPLPVVSAA